MSQITIRRVEWVPVEFDYTVEADSFEEALKKLQAFDEHGDDKIGASRYRIFVNTDAEPTEIDEMEYWKVDVDGKLELVCDLIDDEIINGETL